MSEDKRKPVLDDHVRVKKRLVPPFVNSLGAKLSEYSWTRQLVPESIWLALIVNEWGYKDACKICIDFMGVVNKSTENRSEKISAKFSAFLILSEEDKRQVSRHLKEATRHKINTALRPILSIVVDHPLCFLSEGDQLQSSDGDRISEVLRDIYDRNGRLSVLSMAVAYYVGVEQERIHVAPHLINGLTERFKIIADYPATEAARLAAGSFRVAAPMLFMTPQYEGHGFQVDDPWVSKFWDAVAGFGPCLAADNLQDDDPEEDDVSKFIVNYSNAIKQDLCDRLERWDLNLNEIESYEVVSALLCRQATLAIELASSPAIWNPHTAPIMLRAMADVFINLAWILKDPKNRAKKYIEDGLGAMKLQIAHQRCAFDEMTDPNEIEQMRQMIEIWSQWLTTQRMDQFVEVNLGSWSGLNTRKMAEEAGFIDFYNHVYQPFSGAVHSNWTHVSNFNLIFCQNPAHRGHRSPAIAPTTPDLHWLFLASKYFRKTLGHFDEVKNLSNMPHRAFDFIVSQAEN